MTENNINIIQDKAFKEYQKNDYHRLWSNNFVNYYGQHERIYDIAELGLITTEVTETIEEIRNKNPDIEDMLTKIGFECADIIIRTLNFMSRKGLSAEYFINTKIDRNMLREKLHNKEV